MKLPIAQIKPNPTNPRTITDESFQKLVQSLRDFPEMAEVREVVINKDHVILGGNMRFRAMVEAGWTEVPVRIVDWPEEKQREFVIKDNVSGGEWDWDKLANEWDIAALSDWGVPLPAWDKDNPDANLAEDDQTLQPFTVYFTNPEINRILAAIEGGFDPRKAVLETLDENTTD